MPAAGTTSTFSSQINNNGSVTQNGLGMTVFADRSTNKNSYTGGTTISAGILQANDGNGLPTASFLTLDGGILQSYGSTAVTFSRAWAPRAAVGMDPERRRFFGRQRGDERQHPRRHSHLEFQLGRHRLDDLGNAQIEFLDCRQRDDAFRTPSISTARTARFKWTTIRIPPPIAAMSGVITRHGRHRQDRRRIVEAEWQRQLYRRHDDQRGHLAGQFGHGIALRELPRSRRRHSAKQHDFVYAKPRHDAGRQDTSSGRPTAAVFRRAAAL